MRLELDEEQQKVVDYPDSCLCIAGPGSGKTRTLVAKAEELDAKYKDFICLTFTRSAAREMRDRMPGILAQTIHSYCYGQVDWDGSFDRLLKNFIRLKDKPKFDWVLVDEIQDLTKDQMDVVLDIVGDKLFAVGDPYQSIYGFNGALGLKALSKFKSVGCKQFELKNNYRSSPIIVDQLNKVYPRGLVSSGVRNTGLTAILCRTNADVERVGEFLSGREIGYTVRLGASEISKKKEIFRGSESLRLMTCHCSKGLEFDWVILYNWLPMGKEKECLGSAFSISKYPEAYREDWASRKREKLEDMNLYYVSVARASKGFRFAKNLDLIMEDPIWD